MLVQNPAALRQYNERCQQIAEQERQLAELEEKRQLARQTIDDVTVGGGRGCSCAYVPHNPAAASWHAPPPRPHTTCHTPPQPHQTTPNHTTPHHTTPPATTPPIHHNSHRATQPPLCCCHPSLQSRWLPALQRIVSTVNATFSANFRTVGCAGDVVLHEAPDEDFEHYAIEIRCVPLSRRHGLAALSHCWRSIVALPYCSDATVRAHLPRCL